MKLILVKAGDDNLKLFPATAIGIHRESGMVMLKNPVPSDDGELTDMVPAERCLEYNHELLDMVNILAERSNMAIASIHQLMDIHARPAEIVEGEEDAVTAH